MKQLLKFASSFVLMLFVLSCNSSDKKKKKDQDNEKVAKKEQIYSKDTSGVSLQWIAYKFTDKLGVAGTFDRITFKQENESGSIEDLLKNAEMTIATASVNSNNEIRDPKLRTFFFEVFNTDTITGKILDAEQGSGVLELKMNDISNDVEYDYTLKNDTLFLTTHLDLQNWNGEKALNSLNKECYELHTGLDGISKLWPDVDVTIKLPVYQADSLARRK